MLPRMADKKTRGRPRKAAGDSADSLLHVRVDATIKDAIESHRQQELLRTEAESVRDLLKIALRQKDLLK